MKTKEKKIVVITGASKGIGYATVGIFLKNGYIVYGLSRGGCDLHGVHSVACDITDTLLLREAIEDIIAQEGHIDILINNAGAGISGAIEKTSTEEAKWLFNLNFFAPFEAVKTVVPHMRAKGKGKIICVGSVAGALHIPFQAIYSASKAALEALSNALRGELKPFGIKVSTILPGDTYTNFTAARQRNFAEDDINYGLRISRSIKRMEKDERNGMTTEKVAHIIYKVTKKKNPRPIYTAGAKYRLFMFLGKIFPKRWIQSVIDKIYAK
jgi:short-subunit dehydrogenase